MATKRTFNTGSHTHAREFLDWFGKYPDCYEPPRKNSNYSKK